MRSLRVIVLLFFSFILLLEGHGFGQSSRGTDRPAASAAIFEVSGGYVFMSSSSPSLPRLNLNGVDGSALLQLTPRWGATLDLTFARAGNVPHTDHADTMFSGLVGPVYYLMDRPRTQVFVHALIGLAVVDSAVPINATEAYRGYESRFSYAFGGGVERAIGGPFGLRLSADYQRTTFLSPTLALQGQNNLRVTTSLVYRFGNRDNPAR